MLTMSGLLTLLRSSKHPRLLFNPPGICGTRSLSRPVHSPSVPAATSPKVWPCQENSTWFWARTHPKDDGSWLVFCPSPDAGPNAIPICPVGEAGHGAAAAELAATCTAGSVGAEIICRDVMVGSGRS